MYKKILAGNFETPDFVSEQLKDLIKKVLVTEPKDRVGIQEILDHPWLTENTKMPISEGIIIGYNQIPIEDSIIDLMTQYGFSEEEIQELFKCLDANSHNHMTTTYYLFYKQLKKQGKLKCQYEKVNQETKSEKRQMSEKRKKEYEKAILDSITKIRTSSQQPFQRKPANKERQEIVNKSVDVKLNQSFMNEQPEELPKFVEVKKSKKENSSAKPEKKPIENPEE